MPFGRVATLALFGYAISVGPAACESDDSACTPGATRACACTGGSKGAQPCRSDGSGYAECVCDIVDAGVGGSSGSGASGGASGAPDTGTTTTGGVGGGGGSGGSSSAGGGGGTAGAAASGGSAGAGGSGGNADGSADSGPDGASSCIDLTCPSSSPQATICGQLFDAERGNLLQGPVADGVPCSSPTSDGPCSISIRLYDALELAASPGTATPIVGTLLIDSCGQYRITDIEPPTLGYIALVTDDASGDQRVPAMRPLPLGPSAVLRDIDLLAVRHATDSTWTTSAGDPFSGQTFSERGALLLTFLHGSTPATGVSVTRSGAAIAADDYYFSDADLQRRVVSASAASTGMNGSAIAVGTQNPVEYSGVGGEPAGCHWPTALMAIIPGHLAYGFLSAETSSGAQCP